MRPRKLSKLFFQFGHLAPPNTDAHEIAMALSHAGLIAVLYDQTPIKYVETDAMRAIPKDDFERVITKAITEFFDLAKQCGDV